MSQQRGACSSLRTYISSALMATFWTYDYACSLHEEWTFLLRSHWTKVKGLYIVTRYLPFIMLAMNLCVSFTPNENPEIRGVGSYKFRVQHAISRLLRLYLSYLLEICFFILRTYALWNKNRILLIAVLSTFFMRLARSRELWGATGVRPVIGSSYLFFSFAFSNWNWRTNPSHLYVVLVNHNISYYACGFLFSVTNVFTSLLLKFIILAILATRMHLHLWQTDRHPHGSSTLASIPMSEMLSVNSTV
ncbi:uncharacterized protein F5891DRAFT_980945 [Suillus fuscotomentosus]|uniref:DUF6533 domain-containing protein n=1 Tax=Suillus fuscotomentosus TaxID=1912939 RepID=A0AAD4HJA4_9AGAM|nr:uncharacterized protein F5891DRAFT_980945 [Suillus fuscotomentosus]KAG1899715.1 hypothetical protein F5891DRAFT_980945 [Suillus fuscotomentosus]